MKRLSSILTVHDVLGMMFKRHEVFIIFVKCDYLLGFESHLVDVTPKLVIESLRLHVTHVVK